MGIGNIGQLAQVTALLLIFIFSFFVIIPLSVNINQFKGNCLLYATGEWDNNQTSALSLDVNWGVQGYCNLSIFMGVLSMILSFGYMVYVSMYLIQGNDLPWLSGFIKMVVMFLMTMMFLISSCTMSVGFNQWCALLTKPPLGLYSCEAADVLPLKVGEKIDTGDFYVEFGMAQFGAWSSWLCWLVMFVFSLVRMIKYNKHENFLQSMSRERQRLLSNVRENSGEYSGI